MTDASDLMKGHHILTEIVPNGHGKMVRRQVLFFRADTVIKILQERNAHLQEISDRLKAAVARHKERKEMLDQAASIIRVTECRCKWYHDECVMCARCAWLEDLKHMRHREEDDSHD